MTPAEKIAEKHNSQIAGAGHNSDPRGQVRSYVDRLVKLEEEKKAIADDIRDVKLEAKERGLNPAALTRAVKRSMETDEQREKRRSIDEVTDGYLAMLSLLD